MEGECPPGLGSIECWGDTVWLILRASVSLRTILNGTWLDAPMVFSALLFVVLVDLASTQTSPPPPTAPFRQQPEYHSEFTPGQSVPDVASLLVRCGSQMFRVRTASEGREVERGEQPCKASEC